MRKFSAARCVSTTPGGPSPVRPGRSSLSSISRASGPTTPATGTESLLVGPTVATVLPGATPTLYLNAQAAFSAGSVSAFGSLFALPLPPS